MVPEDNTRRPITSQDEMDYRLQTVHATSEKPYTRDVVLLILHMVRVGFINEIFIHCNYV
ncbi:hypothetical protein J6590_034339 [Homalodisca vitripennis]|nr:hypothetical protein J6590_034339 [Homalodisca vitripennis]